MYWALTMFNQLLHLRKQRFLLVGFNICFDMVQSLSIHSLMDGLEREVWDMFAMEVIKYDAWTYSN